MSALRLRYWRLSRVRQGPFTLRSILEARAEVERGEWITLEELKRSLEGKP